MSDVYITPVTKIHSSFKEAKEFFDTYGGIYLFGDEKELSIEDIAQGKRNLVVGEPGVGKTVLLSKISEHLDSNGVKTDFIKLREGNARERIKSFAKENEDVRKAVLLDGLDEIKANDFSAVLQVIEELSASRPDIEIYLSARWVFYSKYVSAFPGYRIITISPFTQKKVREYLQSKNHDEGDVDDLLNRIMSFSHSTLVIQIPRYLTYLEEYLQKEDIKSIRRLSRNELFEYFIYRKLEYEDKKLNDNKRAIIKRVLEKLALTMEIYQTNSISQDELMTFFDDLHSDLKLAALSSIDLGAFFDYSLLNVGTKDIDKVEFENTEFQEYLAAKEITRFPDPNHAAFTFATNPDINEIYPTWFNAWTFLVDMQPELLEQLVEFSGIWSAELKVADEAFFTFISRINPDDIELELKRRLFQGLITYNQRTLQWIPGTLTSALPGFFDASLEPFLKSQVSAAESEENTRRYVPLANIAYVVAYLNTYQAVLDSAYWREKLIQFASDKNENGVLQRHALFALEQLRDPSVIDDLPDTLIDSQDELVVRAFLSLCTEVDPNNPKSIHYFIKAISRDDLTGRYGLFALKEEGAIKQFLDALISDENFQREFFDDILIFKKQDLVLVEHIESVFNEDIQELCRKIIISVLDDRVSYHAKDSHFVAGLWRLLKRKDPKGFVTDILRRIKESKNQYKMYLPQHFFVEAIDQSNVSDYLDLMIEANQKNEAFSVMLSIKASQRDSAEKIFEAGRIKLQNLYDAWEHSRTATGKPEVEERQKRLIGEFRELLEPSPGKYSNKLFEFYNRHTDDLDSLLSESDCTRLRDLLEGTVLEFFDPAQYEVTITNEHDGARTYTTSQAVFILGDSLKTAKHLGIDVTPYRQHIINFIPFAFNEQLKIIFDLVPDISPEEMSPVIDVYRRRDTDLWRYQTISFINAVEKYHSVEAAGVLQEIVRESAYESYCRRRALVISELLLPDVAFLKQVYELYKESEDSIETQLADSANGLLITSYHDSEAINWRLNRIVEKAVPFKRPGGAHSVGDIESELSDKEFARPLMELSQLGHEVSYLQLLETAMDIWGKGEEFHEYGSYLWSIVYAYFNNLKKHRSYEPLHRLEKKVSEIHDKEGANWFAARMADLRREYLADLGKPKTISEAVAQYNEERAHKDKKILNSEDLFRQLQAGIDTDLRRWIEGEGAYEIITKYKNVSGIKQYEKLVQMTIKSQVENILLWRGFEPSVLREAQLLDGKKPDILVWYGFVGPVVIEIKLSSNSDLKGLQIDKSLSYSSMNRYMQGFGASHGIFLVMNNTGAKNIGDIKRAFETISGVWVQSFDCAQDPKVSQQKSSGRKTTKSKASKKKALKKT